MAVPRGGTESPGARKKTHARLRAGASGRYN